MRPRIRPLVALVCLVVALSLVAPSVASARKYGLGDSVMAGATQELRSRNFKVNTSVSRQFSAAPSIIRKLARRDRLPRKVVIHLGNNGTVDSADCRRAVKLAGNRQVYLVTVKVPRSWRKANNKRLRTCARRHDAKLIDWYSYSKSHKSWFYSDGFHLTPRGQKKYARFLSRMT